MRVVLYAHDFEPITVIELSTFVTDYLERYGRCSIAVPMPLLLDAMPSTTIRQTYPRVDIIAERLRFHRGDHLMLFTADEESALLLKSVFLPGQYRQLHSETRDAYARGFLAAITALGHNGS